MCWISFARMSIQRQGGKGGKEGTDLLCIEAACVLQGSVAYMCSYKPGPLPNDRESTALVKHFTWILFSLRLFLDILFVAWSLPWVLLAKFGLF
jgi:hypothetical protein